VVPGGHQGKGEDRFGGVVAEPGDHMNALLEFGGILDNTEDPGHSSEGLSFIG